jgi:YidC/Oxa1 family membrane protein insertase
MDKNTTTGLVIIGLILIVSSFWLTPSQDEIEQLQQKEDSIKLSKEQQEPLFASEVQEDEVFVDTVKAIVEDSASQAKSAKKFGPFLNASKGDINTHYLENDLVKLGISTKGGSASFVELKKFKTYDKQPLILIDGTNSEFGLNLIATNVGISTKDLFFKKIESSPTSLTMRLEATPTQYIDYVYTIKEKSYLIDFDINIVGLNELIPANANYIDLIWAMDMIQTEQAMKNERINSKVFYKFKGDDVENLSENGDDEEDLKTPIRWISYKQHFFSSSLIAKDHFDEAKIKSETIEESNRIKSVSSKITLDFEGKSTQQYQMSMYFGPNHFQTLKKLDLGLESQIRLGWAILGWINRFVVIPVFNFFGGFGWNYGIVILVLTILLKLVLFPLTYKSYMSMAKMRVLKPEMEEIKQKFEKEPTKLQQEYMKLYKKAGVNPLGGCLPMVLQMPILIAFFYFFPSSIELRQESFLWATDLSTYDSIWTFGEYPIINKIYGDHVSLFTLLMTVSTIIYTRLNNQVSGATGQMKMIGYVMPIFFLGFFNNYSAGLTYYYFCANMITFAQQYMIRKFVDDDAIHRKIQEHKKKPVSLKKSKFQQRLEDMAKKRGVKPKK